MKRYILKYKGWLATTVLFRCIGALMQVFIAILIQNILDTAINKDFEGFKKAIIFSSIFFIVMTFNNYLNQTSQFIYMKKTLTKFKEDVFRGVLRKDYKSFNDENTAEYISNLTNDISLVQGQYITPYLEMIGDVVIFVGTTAVLLWINPWITLVMFATSILLFIIPAIFGTPISKRQGLVSDELSKFTTKIKDIFSGYELIKSYNIEDSMTEEFLTCNNQVEHLKLRSNHIQGISASVSMLLGIMTQVSAIALGGYFLMTGKLTVGSLFAVVQLGNGLFGPIMWIVTKVTMIKGMKEVNSKLLKIINEGNIESDKKSLKEFNENIKLENISFTYNDEIQALDNVSISFSKNKKYAIVGRSGSGKSTILRLLLGYYDNFEGSISFDGQDTKEICKDSINKQISIIHQNVYMFDESIKKNILLGKEFSKDELKKALQVSGVEEFLSILPDGVDSQIGENGSNLSGGQKQRVAIARSLIQNTPILLLDEGTSALDTKTAYEIEDTLLRLDDLTVLTVTHKLSQSLLSRYDEIIVMDKGKVVEMGSFSELVNTKGEFYNLYSIESEDNLNEEVAN